MVGGVLLAPCAAGVLPPCASVEAGGVGEGEGVGVGGGGTTMRPGRHFVLDVPEQPPALYLPAPQVEQMMQMPLLVLVAPER